MKPLLNAIVVLLIWHTTTYCQSNDPDFTVDSLMKKLLSTDEERQKIDIYNKLGESYLFHNADSLKYFANLAHQSSSKLKYSLGIGKSYNLLGFVAQNENDFKKAIENFKSANAIFKELKDEASQASTLHNLGGIYIRIRELESSKKILLESLELSEKVNDTKTLAKTTYQLGNLEKASRNFDKALEYYQKSLKSAESLNDKTSIGNAYGGIGLVYDATKDYTKAIESPPIVKQRQSKPRKSYDLRGFFLCAMHVYNLRDESSQ